MGTGNSQDTERMHRAIHMIIRNHWYRSVIDDLRAILEVRLMSLLRATYEIDALSSIMLQLPAKRFTVQDETCWSDAAAHLSGNVVSAIYHLTITVVRRYFECRTVQNSYMKLYDILSIFSSFFISDLSLASIQPLDPGFAITNYYLD